PGGIAEVGGIERVWHPPVSPNSLFLRGLHESQLFKRPLSGRPIAKRIVAKMKLHWQRKVVNIKNVIAGHGMAEELQKTVVSRKELEGFHPAHAADVYAPTQVSGMS